jgi:Flp pilus assembly protein TadD
VDEGNAEALYKIGAVHTMRGNTGLAEAAFRGALAKDPRNVGALTGVGIALLKRRAYDEAQSHLERAVTITPGIAKAHNGLGVIADLERDYKAAQGHYQRALEANPSDPSLLNNLGYSRYLSGNWDGAIGAFREALLADPTYEMAWRNLALVYARQERYADAVDALSKVEAMPQAYNDVGYVAMVGGKLEDAEGFFAEAKRQSPAFYALADSNHRRVAILQGDTATP